MILLENYFLWLMIYSILGWIYESILCSIKAGKFINRGFLNGTYCPIYGWGAILDILVLGKIENPALLFLLGVIVTCTLEYLTSYVMEKMFHARWWDYSYMKFNLNGRVCLVGALIFGMFSVLLILFIHPMIETWTGQIPTAWKHVITGTAFVLFFIDNVVTFRGMSGFTEKLDELKAYIRRNREFELPEPVNWKYLSIMNKFSNQQRRMLAAFPKLKEDFGKLQDKVKNKKEKKGVK